MPLSSALTLSLILASTLALFLWGRFRPELIAIAALLVATIVGVVPVDAAFAGFGHPAVITVAAVLVVSRGLGLAGIVDLVARPLGRVADRPLLLLGGLCATTALLSSSINNVGALALLMPVAIRLARSSGRSPSMYLMPLAFASLLGGMTTLIGTPPNLIVSGFRLEAKGEPFGFFAFTPVGGAIAVAGVLFLVLVGHRLVPERTGTVTAEEAVKVGPYLTEATVPAESPVVGQTLRSIQPREIVVVAIVRDTERLASPAPYRQIAEGDVLVLLGESEAIEAFVKERKLAVVGQDEAAKAEAKEVAEAKLGSEALESEEIGVVEAVVMPEAAIAGSSASSMRLRERHGLNLLGIAREGRRIRSRLAETRFRAGDVLLLQGPRSELLAELADFGCLPLAEREVTLGREPRHWHALILFLAAIVVTALGWLPAAVAFSSAAVLMIATSVLSVRQAYAALDLPVLLLLAAMLPVGLAIESTGLAATIGQASLALGASTPVWVMLAIVLVATMFLSDLVNNAAAAVMMCPVALSVARGIDAPADPFLLAVAIGASCAFLTPIGHQSNLLVMGPGGYRFGDYWRLGLALEILIAIVAVPILALLAR